MPKSAKHKRNHRYRRDNMPYKPKFQYINFCFTYNNYKDKDIKTLIDLDTKYLIFDKEIGEKCGTPHLQGYCELRKKTQGNVLKKLLPGMWFTPRNADDPAEAAGYMKLNGNVPFYEEGTISLPGKRTDFETLYDMIEAGCSDYDLQCANPGLYIRCHKGFDRARLNYNRTFREFTPVKVTVLWGDTGAGKSRYAYTIDPDLHEVNRSHDRTWWDGYTDQKTVLLNDFYGHIPMDHILKLTDGYSINCDTKGNFAWKRWNHFIFTSNVHPREWYPDYPASFQRRLTDIIHLTALEKPRVPIESEMLLTWDENGVLTKTQFFPE